MDKQPGPDNLDTRRTFGKKVVAGTAALTVASLAGGLTYYLMNNDDHGHGTDGDHFDEAAARLRMQEQLAHRFYQNPNEWRRQNEGQLRTGFDLSEEDATTVKEFCVEDALRLGVQPGVRMRRTPGSTILEERDAAFRRIRQCVEGFQMNGHVIRYEANAHEDCGAGIVFARNQHIEGDTDAAAEREIRQRVAMLRDEGIHASFGQRVPLAAMDREAHAHPAIMGIVSPDGTFHDWHPAGLPASFITSSHDPEEVGHGVDIMLKVASGPHGYSRLLRDFHLLVLRHPDDPRLSDSIFRSAQRAAEAVANARDIRVHFYHWSPPERA